MKPYPIRELMPFRVLDACGSISHALFELRRDPAAELAPWGTVGAETDTGAHRADLADQIMGLRQRLAQMTTAAQERAA